MQYGIIVYRGNIYKTRLNEICGMQIKAIELISGGKWSVKVPRRNIQNCKF